MKKKKTEKIKKDDLDLRSFDERWESLDSAMFPPDMPDDVKKQFKDMYFLGAYTAMHIAKLVYKDSDLEPEEVRDAIFKAYGETYNYVFAGWLVKGSAKKGIKK